MPYINLYSIFFIVYWLKYGLGNKIVIAWVFGQHSKLPSVDNGYIICCSQEGGALCLLASCSHGEVMSAKLFLCPVRTRLSTHGVQLAMCTRRTLKKIAE